MENKMEHCHHHHHEISHKTVKYLLLSFIINIVLSIVEIIGGIISGSMALIGDALHNTSDAFSILIAVIAFKIGHKKADNKYTFGFKRAEVIGGYTNLILLFVAGVYLAVEGIERLINPQTINGSIIIWVSVVALVIDGITAKLSHHGAGHNTNMRMVFLHNLADAFGSIGVIISGLCVLYFDIYWVDGVVALIIAAYMIYQSILTFPKVINILMNAVPDNIDIEEVKEQILSITGVCDVHHLHIWSVNEHDISLECHIVTQERDIIHKVTDMLKEKFSIEHCNIQIEHNPCCKKCEL